MKRIANYLIATALMAFTFTSCEDVPSPYGSIEAPVSDKVVIAPTGSGTVADPYNVAAAQELISSLGADVNSETIYVKGYISDLGDGVSTQYWNAQFYISDTQDGSSGQLLVYRTNYLDNQPFTSADQIKAGDEVIMCGKVINYKGNTPEFTTGTYIYSINGSTSGGGTTPQPSAGTLGTKDAPLTIAKALEAINALADGATSDQDAYVKGKVVKVNTTADNFAKYGNLNYYISEDGTDNNTIYVYAGDAVDGAKFSSVDDIANGDEVVVFGKLQKYVKDGNVTPEIAKGNYLVSLTKGGGTTPTPSGGAAGSGTQADPYNVAAISEICAKLGDKEISTDDYYIKGKICSIKYTFSAQYGTATFNISDNGATGGTEFTAYSVLYYNNASWVDSNTQVAVGDEVVLYGKITNYNGTLETASKKACIYSLNGKTSDDGGSQGGGSQGGGDEGDIVAAFGDLNCSNLGAIALSDGTTLAVAQEDGKNEPIYHESTKIIRMYARNSITVNAGSKKIAKVVFTYDTYNGTAYRGNGEMYAEAGSSKLTPAKDETTVSFSDVNNSTVKVVNWYEQGNSGGTQFRISKIAITYAK